MKFATTIAIAVATLIGDSAHAVGLTNQADALQVNKSYCDGVVTTTLNGNGRLPTTGETNSCIVYLYLKAEGSL